MGSGHFLVFALPLLVRLRIEEEKLDPQAAVIAVLKDNIHGLELDERCTQIAAFNVALKAWKLAGYQTLPTLNIACSGLAPNATEAEWLALAGKDDRLRRGMMRLYSLFKDAPVLGSLINPRAQAGDLIEAEFHELAPLLAAALAPTENQKERVENDAVELAVIAQGLAKAAELLAGQFVLTITNVPYLGLNKQSDVLRAFCSSAHPEAKADLATCFVERSRSYCSKGGTSALVTPQSWLFLGTYKTLRQRLLSNLTLNIVAKLGPGAFETISGEVVNVALISISVSKPHSSSSFLGIDTSEERLPNEKAQRLVSGIALQPHQQTQLRNADSRIVLSEASTGNLLIELANSYEGIGCGDIERFACRFFEVPEFGSDWKPFRGTTTRTGSCSGAESIIFWQNGRGAIYELAELLRERLKNTWQRGCQAWNKRGIAVNRMGDFFVEVYDGEIFDSNIAAVIPKDHKDLLPILAFMSSDVFRSEVRRIDQSMKITNVTFLKVPFDLAHWRNVAAQKFPAGLPKPESNDPTQWFFRGHPRGSDQALHVSVARLLGYRWPRQTGSSFPDCPALGADGLEKFAAEDGIVCLPAVNREQPAAARVRQILAAALGTIDERTLIAGAGLKGSKSKTLEAWLCDEFFEQHAKLFLDRPFIWHLWDGRADGFHALVNYHRLDHANLQKLTYSYLGDWIQQQAEDTKADKPGAAERLGAARALQNKLDAILKGEAPLDIFVRWKPLKEQAQGWHPDLDDGIRQNIRPFLLAGDVGKRGAGLFRTVPLSLKDKDRGAEPHRPKKTTHGSGAKKSQAPIRRAGRTLLAIVGMRFISLWKQRRQEGHERPGIYHRSSSRCGLLQQPRAGCADGHPMAG